MEFLCKLDIEKAYDNMVWDFLWYILERMGLESSGDDGLVFAFPQ